MIEIFDPVTNTLTTVGNITEFRSGHSNNKILSKQSYHITHIISNSKVFMTSGYNRVNLETGIPNANKTSEIYNIDQNLFISVYGDL